MALKFRNLTVTPDDPVDTWGVEGILTAIDRGSLRDWRRIVAALANHEVLLDLEQALDLAEDVGAVALLRRAVAEYRAATPTNPVGGEDAPT